MANNRNKNMNKKRPAKKSSCGNNSSEYKENRPKKVKINKPDANDSIEMSEQLQMKKRMIQNNRRQGKNGNRICPNKKPMPSLADLEKMYEDSDSDVTPIEITEQVLPSTPHKEEPIVIDVDALISPITRTRIKEQVNKILFNSEIYTLSDNMINIPPKNPDYDTSKDLLPVASSPNEKFIDKFEFEAVDEMNSTNYQESPQDKQEINAVVKKASIVDNNHLNNNNSDSDNTIEYQLTPSRLQNTSVPRTFSPLPSTSKDNQTIMKNDELFNESLKKSSETKECDLEIIEIPAETIIIDDETNIQEPQQYVNRETDKEMLTVVVPIENKSPDGDSKYNDDDCMIVEMLTITEEQEPNVIEVTDNQDQFRDSVVKSDEIIDVDVLIAQNQSILHEFGQSKKLDSSNLIIDVSSENASSENKINSQPEISNTAPGSPRLVLNVHNQTNNECELVNVTNVTASSSRNVPCVSNETTQINEGTDCRVINIYHPISDNSNNIVNIPNNQNPYPTSQRFIDYFEQYNESHPWQRYYDITQNSGHISEPTSTNRSCNTQRSRKEEPMRNTARNLINMRIRKNKMWLKRQYMQRTTALLNQRNTDMELSQISPSNQGGGDININETGNNVAPHTPQESALKLGDCPICMDKLSAKEIGSTICGHVFCMNCLKAAIASNKRCPTCRKVIKNNGYHKIFL